MTWIRTIAREIFGLFVDDGSFALAILGWLALFWFLTRYLTLHFAAGPMLFAGFAAILLRSTYLRAPASRPPDRR